jgi:hypothetical protein
MSIPENRLPAVRRILVSNLPLPTTLSTVAKAEPAVEVTSEDLSSVPILDGNYCKISILNHKSVPASTAGQSVSQQQLTQQLPPPHRTRLISSQRETRTRRRAWGRDCVARRRKHLLPRYRAWIYYLHRKHTTILSHLPCNPPTSSLMCASTGQSQLTT